jgi:hypothetical protein
MDFFYLRASKVPTFASAQIKKVQRYFSGADFSFSGGAPVRIT